MHYVTVENLTKAFGVNPLFDNISFHINEGDKIALVARNGVGKSTLLRILAGEGTVDTGKLWINKEVTAALFEQDPKFEEDKTVLENIFHSEHPVINAIRNYEAVAETDDVDAIASAISRMDELDAWMFESKVKEVLSKLNIHNLNDKV